MQLHRPRQWGACWLALTLWQTLDLDVFWAERLPPSRKGTRWDLVLFVLGAYRLIAPGSEWRLHREWYGRTALSDLLMRRSPIHTYCTSAMTAFSCTKRRCSRI
jgi:hypothetical protein